MHPLPQVRRHGPLRRPAFRDRRAHLQDEQVRHVHRPFGRRQAARLHPELPAARLRLRPDRRARGEVRRRPLLRRHARSLFRPYRYRSGPENGLLPVLLSPVSALVSPRFLPENGLIVSAYFSGYTALILSRPPAPPDGTGRPPPYPGSQRQEDPSPPAVGWPRCPGRHKPPPWRR